MLERYKCMDRMPYNDEFTKTKLNAYSLVTHLKPLNRVGITL